MSGTVECQQQDHLEESKQLWDSKAEFWDTLHGDTGNTFHRTLVGPCVEGLLLHHGQSSSHREEGASSSSLDISRLRILDIGCGNGTMARRLVDLGAREVVACDFSRELVRLARKRSEGNPLYEKHITYRGVDATNEEELAQLVSPEGFDVSAKVPSSETTTNEDQKFDLIVSTMAVMDMADIKPMFSVVAKKLLKRSTGRLVIVTCHPVLNSGDCEMFVEDQGAETEEERGGEEASDTISSSVSKRRRGVKVTNYLHVPPRKEMGAPGEPNPHYYYHRTMSEIINSACQCGLLLDAMDEPSYPVKLESQVERKKSWGALWDLSPVIGMRFLVPAQK